MRNTLIHLALLAGVLVPGAVAQTYKSQAAKYPPVEEYLMPQPAGIALAKSAGPSNISDRATIKVLTASGFSVVHQGDNGFVCMVMRGFSAPMYTPAQFRDLVYDSSLRAPICFDPKAAKEVMPYYELRTKLAMQGRVQTRSPKACRPFTREGNCPKEME
jgi:hypothetical protein